MHLSQEYACSNHVNHIASSARSYAVAALASVQLLSGFLRPQPGTPLRRLLWNPLHFTLGRGTQLLAWATCLVGEAPRNECSALSV